VNATSQSAGAERPGYSKLHPCAVIRAPLAVLMVRVP